MKQNNKILFFAITFLIILFIAYLSISIPYPLYYKQLIASIISLSISLIVFIFLNNFKNIKIILSKILFKINNFIDKYGIYFLLGVFFIFINYITFSKHLNYHSSGFDLGIFDQVVYQYSNLEFPASSSIREIDNIEADHFHPILGLYALFYKIYASPLVLIFLQNLFFVLGGFGIYKISKFKLNIPVIGFGLVFLYLIFRGNINALLFDFHPLVVAVSLFPWLFYFSIKKKWLYYFLLLIPVLLSKENLSIYVLFFGIYQFFIQKDRVIGLISFGIGGLYFYLVMNYFLPAMGGGGKYWSYDAIGATPKELLLNAILHPIIFIQIIFSSGIKIVTYLHHLGSGLYLALFSPVIIFLIPSYAQKFLSSREDFWTLNFHYSIDIYWIIAVGIIFAFVWIKNKYKKNYKDIFIVLGIFIFLNSFLINIYKSPLLYSNYYLENKEVLDKIISDLPKNIKISTQNNIVPHFSHNKNVYIFPNLGNSEYILLNTKIDSGWPLEKGKSLNMYIEKLKNKEKLNDIRLPFIKELLTFDRKYELIKEEKGVLLFKIILE